MNDNDLELKLLAGLPIEIDGVGTLYMPTIKEVINIGESNYNQYLSSILFNKSNIEGLQNEKATNFELILAYSYHDTSFRETILNALELIFKEKTQLFMNEQYAFFYLGELQDERIIDENKLGIIKRIIKKGNHIKDEPEFVPANSKAQEMIDRILKGRKNKPKQPETMNLHSIASGVAWKSHGMNILNVFDLTIYQLYDAFSRLEGIDNYSSTLTGIYSGTVDPKNINFAQIHWAKVLNLK